MKRINIQLILEYIWIVLSIILLSIALKTTFTVGFGDALSSYLLATLCLLMYLIRRNKRIKESGKQSN
jgi:hypothetical protein